MPGAVVRVMSTLWLQAGVMVFLAVTIECGASVLLRIIPLRPTFDPGFVSTADTYEGAGWALPLLETLSTLRNRWQPYLYWVPESTTSPFLNVAADGRRRTVHPDAALNRETACAIAMFGG